MTPQVSTLWRLHFEIRSVVEEDASAEVYHHGCHRIDFGERSAPRLPFPRSRGHASVPPIVNSNFPMCHTSSSYLSRCISIAILKDGRLSC